jgi:mono/diheme cytochrome c family protein
MPPGVLAWNHETAEATVKSGTINAFMSFSVTNVFTNAVTITHVATSCGCTVPKLPPMPWILPPGGTGTIDITMNLAGKGGSVIKTMTVNTDQGFKTLYVKGNIEAPPAGMMGEAERLKNLQIAMVNRQAVFQGDCVTCHVTPARGKLGGDLYDAACGICHDAEHRASMVPDLRNLQKETNADYWRTWITTSMEGKLMPAFGIEHGGFLNAAEIESLVQYLTTDFVKGTNALRTASSAPH